MTSLHAFVDESVRGTYMICAVMIPASEVASARRVLRGLLKGSQGRLHMAKENVHNKKSILNQVSSMEVVAQVITISISGQSQRKARDKCLKSLVGQLLEMKVQRVVIESCDQDKADLQVMGDELARLGALHVISIVHMRPHEEPLLWIPDVIGWAYGKAGAWRKKIEGLLHTATHL